jgi:uncharacterized protein YndB with AHSA1/START domain
MRKVLWGVLAIISVFSVAILLSPYSRHKGQRHRAISTTILIEAKPEVVFSYLSNSANAAKWSVYVDHITILNGSEVKDGMPGSIRRCFKQADEKGVVWDELITIVEPQRRRQLTIFNMVGFPVKAEGLATEQLYENVSGNKTLLTFSLFYLEEPGFLQTVKTFLPAYIVCNIFEQNLNNIKTHIESARTL